MQTVIEQTHNDDGIESLEQITNSGTQKTKEQYMNNRDTENIIDNINDNIKEKVVEDQMMGKLWNEEPICM